MPRPPATPGTARHQKGFTFVELAATVGVVGVLLVVALQSYRSHRDTARARQAADEIAAMAASLKLRWQDERCYPDRLDTTSLGNRVDPWGRPYAYYNVAANGIGGARKDASQNPLNTDFDLYSLGPNGRTSEDLTHRDGRDDVLRARDGGYIGVAKALSGEVIELAHHKRPGKNRKPQS